MPDRNRVMVLTQAGLGLRIGELLALRVQDVNFLGRSVRIEHQLSGLTRERVPPKTPRSRRAIPLPGIVADALPSTSRPFPPLEDGTLYYGHNGQHYDHTYYASKVFKRAVHRLAAEAGSTFPAETSTHDLRRHYASVLQVGGLRVRVAVAERLGHDNATMVIRVYGHVLPDSEDRTRRAVDAAWLTRNADSARTEGTR